MRKHAKATCLCVFTHKYIHIILYIEVFIAYECKYVCILIYVYIMCVYLRHMYYICVYISLSISYVILRSVCS